MALDTALPVNGESCETIFVVEIAWLNFVQFVSPRAIVIQDVSEELEEVQQ